MDGCSMWYEWCETVIFITEMNQNIKWTVSPNYKCPEVSSGIDKNILLQILVF